MLHDLPNLTKIFSKGSPFFPKVIFIAFLSSSREIAFFKVSEKFVSQDNTVKNNSRDKSQQGNRNKNKNQNRNRYRRSVPEQDSHLDRSYRNELKTLRFLTYQLQSFTEHSSEEQLLWSVSPDAWNLKHQLGHLSQYIQFQSNKIQALLEATEFSENFDQDDAIKTEEFNNRSLEILLARFLTNKKRLFSLLYGSKNEQWEIANSLSNCDSHLLQTVKEMNAHFEQLIDAIFMNLQRHKPWYQPTEPSETSEEASESNPISVDKIEAENTESKDEA